MNDTMIPSIIWKSAHQEDVEVSHGQRTACIYCIQEDNAEPPEILVYVSGSSFCVPHAKQYMNQNSQ